MREPIVSVIVAAYNAMKYLKENIESLLAQTLSDFELIYVDDGSKDETLSLLREYESEDERIRIIVQENHGAGHARNTGMKAARGKYILVLDADDYFAPDMLQKTVKKAEKDTLDICIFDHYMCNEQTKEITNGGKGIVFNLLPEREVFCAKDIPDHIFQITGANVWNKLYRREFLREKDIWFQEGVRIDDYYMEIVALSEANRISVLPDRFVYYRKDNPNSQMGKIFDRADDECKACEAVYHTLRERGTLEQLRSSYTKLAYDACINSLYRTHKARFEEIYEAIRQVWIKSLGICDSPEFYFADTYQYEVYLNMQKMSMAEFLLWQLEQTPIVEWKYLLPKEILKNKKRIAIYGAGSVGKDYYVQANAFPEGKVVAWADQRYEELQGMGFPVVSPYELSEISCDVVLIAFENEGLAEKVKDSLEKIGVAREKMLWLRPRVNLLENK